MMPVNKNALRFAEMAAKQKSFVPPPGAYQNAEKGMDY
jgi:hypothetical protein